jgi:phospholipase C
VSTDKPENSSPEAQISATPTAGAIADAELIAPRGLSRRAVLGLGTAGAVAAGITSAFGPGANRAEAMPTTRSHLSGTLADVKHVVVLMQENRSFDHYYGTLPGVRGFSDKQVLEYQNGTTIFQQPDPTRTDGGMLVPFRLDTSKYNAQNAGGLDHSWTGGHAAWNHGAWDRWVSVKGEQTMGFFTSDDLPYHHDLASEFTICDQYHCSLNGPTTPNRVFQWSGTNNPQGGKGGPAIDNPPDYNPVYRWGTYPEQLQNGGVTWKVFANDEVGDGANGLVGDYGDNPLWLFTAYHDSLASTDPAVQQLAVDGGLHGGTWKADSGLGNNVHHVLAEFEAACAAGTLPQVSYIVAPYSWCEHPSASPDYGAVYQNAVVQALFANPDLWESTVLLINYDENDGYFDHVMPPFPESGTADEFVGGLPVGFGTRVPMTVVSPWSRGGWVNSQVFDHTSVIRFIETWTGVKDHNISEWRRAVSGDLTSCFDFSRPDFSIPRLTDTSKLQAAAIADGAKPPVAAPAVGAQVMPVQEAVARRHRPIPYQQNANVAVDRSTGSVTLAMTNTGDAAVSMAVYPNAHLPFVATPFTVSKSAPASYRWNALLTGGHYDFSAYGPNRFLRRFAGRLHPDEGGPAVSAELVGGRQRALRLTLENLGSGDIHFSLNAHDFVTDRKEVVVKGRRSRVIEWALSDGYYDVIVTTDTDAVFRYRFAGHIEKRSSAGHTD